MTDSMIILLPALLSMTLLYWGSQLEEDNILRLVFQGLVLPLFWLSLDFAASFASINYPLNTELVTNLANLSFYTSFLLYAWGVVYLFKISKAIFEHIQSNLTTKKQERYDDD